MARAPARRGGTFPIGEPGAHKIANWSDETARFLAISTTGQPDIVLYPESGKVGAFERLPDNRGLFTLHHLADAVEYDTGDNHRHHPERKRSAVPLPGTG